MEVGAPAPAAEAAAAGAAEAAAAKEEAAKEKKEAAEAVELPVATAEDKEKGRAPRPGAALRRSRADRLLSSPAGL